VAASKASEAVVQLLVDLGADVNVQGGPCGITLQAAARKGSEAVVRILDGALCKHGEIFLTTYITHAITPA